MAWLLDTNVLSEGRKRKPEPKVAAFLASQPLETLYTSIVTFAEIRFGIELLEDSAHRTELIDWLTLKLRPMFDGRLLPITEDVMLKWRVLVEEGRKTGYTFSQPDLIIGATALHYGHTVVTRNRTDYDKAHVPVFNRGKS